MEGMVPHRRVASESTPIGDSIPYIETYYFNSGKVSARKTHHQTSYKLIDATYWNEDGSEQTDTIEIDREPTFSHNGRYGAGHTGQYTIFGNRQKEQY